jgi:hypothetical protein
MNKQELSQSLEKLFSSLGIGTVIAKELWDERLSAMGNDALDAMEKVRQGPLSGLYPQLSELMAFLFECGAISNERQNEVSRGIFRRIRGIAETFETLNERIRRIEETLGLYD